MKKISHFASVLVLGTSFAVPLLAFAAGINVGYLQDYKTSIVSVINTIFIPVLIAIAFITFLWGIYKYFIKGASNESEKGEGRMFALYGIIGFVIIFSVWGIVNIFMGTLGLTAGGPSPAPPTIGGGSTSGSPGATQSFPGLPGSGASYPTTPINGACPGGRIFDSSHTYCITNTSDPTGGYNTGE